MQSKVETTTDYYKVYYYDTGNSQRIYTMIISVFVRTKGRKILPRKVCLKVTTKSVKVFGIAKLQTLLQPVINEIIKNCSADSVEMIATTRAVVGQSGE